MKNIFKPAAFLIAVTFMACSTATSNDPNIVLQSFFEHLAKKDIDGASKYVTSDSKATMEMMKKGLAMAEKMKDSLPKNDIMKDFEDVTYGPAKIMGDSAFILVSSKSGQKPDAEFKLLKENNGWKVDFSMEALMHMGMKSARKLPGNGSNDSIINDEEIKKADSVLKNIDPKTIEQLQRNLEKLK